MDEIKIREYKEKDINGIIELLNRNFKEQQHINLQRDLKWWNWKYENNIFGNPIIYVAELNGEIIASRPFWPWELNIRGKTLKCYQPLDSVVDFNHRGKGLFTKMTNKAIIDNKENLDLIFNFPNEQSLDAYLKLGWSYVGKLKWYVKIYKPIKTLKLLKNYTKLKSVVLEEKDKITSSKLNCLKVKNNFNDKLKTIRSKKFLSWRYLKHPKINYGFKKVEAEHRQLTFIYEINENDFGRELIILDCMGDYDIFDYLLDEIDKISKKYKVSHVLILNKHEIPKRTFLSHLYITYKKKNFVALPINLNINTISKDYNNWDMFLGMHDSV